MTYDYSAVEKIQIAAIHAKGKEFLDLIESIRTPPQEQICGLDGSTFHLGTFDRELHVATERVEEAVLWATKHVTG